MLCVPPGYVGSASDRMLRPSRKPPAHESGQDRLSSYPEKVDMQNTDVSI